MTTNLNTEWIQSRKRLITHANCPDGLASAMLIKHALPHIEVVFCQYSTEQHMHMEARDGDLFCDFTPHPDRVTDFTGVDCGVLDHHKGAKAIVDAFGERGVFADETAEPGVSGALLAFREVWLPMAVVHETVDDLTDVPDDIRLFATLAGIRDTWQKDHEAWEEACAQAEALMFYGADHFLEAMGHDDSEPCLNKDEQKVGRLLFDKKRADAERLASEAFILDRVAVINRNKMSSDTAEALRTIAGTVDEIDMLASFEYKTDPKSGDLLCVFSMRSVADGFDVSKVARAGGGNGHTRAAGFGVRGPNVFRYSPIELLERTIKKAMG